MVRPSTYELIGQEEDGLEAELPVAEVEQVLEGRAEQIDDHGVVVALSAKPPHKGYTDTAREGLKDLGLIFELGVLGLHGLELDGDFLARDDVDTEVNIACIYSVRFATRSRAGHAPKEPEPIFLPSLYLPPTRRSSL